MTLFYITLAIALLLMVFAHHRFARRRPRRRQISSGKILWAILTGDNMSKLTMRVDQNGATASLAFKDAKGNAAVPASPPAWTTTVEGVITLAVAADGLSAQIAPAGVGQTTINVQAEGDATPGVDTIVLTGDVEVTAAEIATGEIDFGPVS